MRPKKQLIIELILHWTECIVCEAETEAVEAAEHRGCKYSIAKLGVSLNATITNTH
jgi:hypothetical protein